MNLPDTWLRVIRPASPDRRRRPRSECECTFHGCGKIVIVYNSDLRRTDNRQSRSCGCYNHWLTAERNRKHRGKKHYGFRDLTGQVNRVGVRAICCVGFKRRWPSLSLWSVICVCGKKKVMSRHQFVMGDSCGCIRQAFAQTLNKYRWPAKGRRASSGKHPRRSSRPTAS
jgi:hypothetical protein